MSMFGNLPILRRLHAAALRLAPGSRIRRHGPGHGVEWHDAKLHRCRITISGANNRVIFGRGAILWNANIELAGRGLVFRIGAGCRVRGGTFVLNDEGSRIEIGDGTTMTGPMMVAQSGHRIAIGRDCMIAYGSDLRCSDGHSVLDAATGEMLNPPADIVLGDHVWIGIHAQILKGATIDEHAIVAARSVVTRPIPAHTLVGGVPARPLRTGVTWDRRRHIPSPLPHAALSFRQIA